MMETKMDNRGTKSALIVNFAVKAQRVDDSCFGVFFFYIRLTTKLRCTLTGFERSYPVRILSTAYAGAKINLFFLSINIFCLEYVAYASNLWVFTNLLIILFGN